MMTVYPPQLLSEIPRLHLDAVNVFVGIDDIARFGMPRGSMPDPP
jgi:hypothetical protein